LHAGNILVKYDHIPPFCINGQRGILLKEHCIMLFLKMQRRPYILSDVLKKLYYDAISRMNIVHE